MIITSLLFQLIIVWMLHVVKWRAVMVLCILVKCVTCFVIWLWQRWVVSTSCSGIDCSAG